MASLLDLFRYKKELEIKDNNGNLLATIWIRILGDHDMQESYRIARIASAKKRSVLKNAESDDYFDEIVAFEEASKEECIETILISKTSNLNAEAISANNREELPTLKNVAVDPDAPTLEEQEELELEKARLELEYQKKLDEYISTKTQEIKYELENTNLETLREMAKEEAINILALTTFLNTLNEQKIFRAIFNDEKCSERTFKTIYDYQNLHSSVKEQLIAAYSELELSPDIIKNS